MKRIAFVCSLGLFFLLLACEKKDMTSLPFVKIYDDQNGNRSFTPLSIIKSTQDNGYLVLSAFDGWRIQVMKIDKDGVFSWNLELPDSYVNAVPSLVNIN